MLPGRLKNVAALVLTTVRPLSLHSASAASAVCVGSPLFIGYRVQLPPEHSLLGRCSVGLNHQGAEIRAVPHWGEEGGGMLVFGGGELEPVYGSGRRPSLPHVYVTITIDLPSCCFPPH